MQASLLHFHCPTNLKPLCTTHLLENIKPVRSKNGLHIFKKLEERKAAGKMKARQILLAFPPEADEQVKKQIAARADSIYKLLLKGENFNKLASAFSNDYISAANNGIMPDIAVGQYDAAFEKQLWSLKKDGDTG